MEAEGKLDGIPGPAILAAVTREAVVQWPLEPDEVRVRYEAGASQQRLHAGGAAEPLDDDNGTATALIRRWGLPRWMDASPLNPTL